MAKYRKKPVVIEAFQLTREAYPGRGGIKFPEWALEVLKAVETISIGEKSEIRGVVIHTLEGNMRAIPGDWIIKGVKGEIYPCKPDIFEATYEKVED